MENNTPRLVKYFQQINKIFLDVKRKDFESGKTQSRNNVTMKTISVKELVKEISPLYPEGKDWEITKEYMMNNQYEKKVVELLIEELKNNDGKFRDPIYVGVLNDDETKENLHVLNGTHRVVAHIIAGSTHVDVRLEDDEPVEHDSETVVLVNVTYKYNEEKDSDYDIFDEFADCLRSLRVNDKIWVTSDCVTGSNNSSLNFYYPIDSVIDTAIDEVIQQISQRIDEIVSESDLLREVFVAKTLKILEDDE